MVAIIPFPHCLLSSTNFLGGPKSKVALCSGFDQQKYCDLTSEHLNFTSKNEGFFTGGHKLLAESRFSGRTIDNVLAFAATFVSKYLSRSFRAAFARGGFLLSRGGSHMNLNTKSLHGGFWCCSCEVVLVLRGMVCSWTWYEYHQTDMGLAKIKQATCCAHRRPLHVPGIDTHLDVTARTLGSGAVTATARTAPRHDTSICQNGSKSTAYGTYLSNIFQLILDVLCCHHQTYACPMSLQFRLPTWRQNHQSRRKSAGHASADLGLLCCRHQSKARSVSQPCHLPKWQHKCCFWFESAERCSGNLSWYRCHYLLTCPTPQLFHLPKVQQKSTLSRNLLHTLRLILNYCPIQSPPLWAFP